MNMHHRGVERTVLSHTSTANDLADWMATATKGDSCVYAAGVMGAYGDTDRQDAISRLAWRYSTSGLVSLVQRRVTHGEGKPGTFDYIAQRTGRVA